MVRLPTKNVTGGDVDPIVSELGMTEAVIKIAPLKLGDQEHVAVVVPVEIDLQLGITLPCW